MIVIVSWAIENNLVYLRSILVGPWIMIVSWSHRWKAVNNLVYFRKDLIVINSYLLFSEALPGVLVNRGKKSIYFRGTRPNFEGNRGKRQYWGTGNIRKQIFDFWGTGEQANLFQGNKGTGTPPHGRASSLAGRHLFIKTNFTRITNNRVTNLHIVRLVRCNSVLYFK